MMVAGGQGMAGAVAGTAAGGTRPWWKDAVVYQVYPRSFADGNGDGVGDLRGLIDRLDHLAWLGVDAVWLSPIFASPMADFGYDISDYCDVDPVFGTIADVDELVAAAHQRDLRVLLDWVPNHTSDQHPWFQASRQDRTNPYADWYVWRDQPCNNWLAAFPRGTAAWTFDEQRGQYYLHSFLRQQPDLNWDNPAVEEAMHATLRFWLDRGVDGLRMDVVHLIGKELDVDDPEHFAERGFSHCPANDAAITHERLRRIRALLDSYPGDRVSVGEVFILDEEKMSTYYGDNDELHLSFNFPFLWGAFDADDLRHRIGTTLELLAPKAAWPTWALSNHDAPRHLTRFGGDPRCAWPAAAMLLTLPGTPFLYQGEELGLVDASIPVERQIDPGLRDGCRAPIPWTAEHHHGWLSEPWLPFADNAATCAAAVATADHTSIAHWYRRLLELRRATPALRGGSIELLPPPADAPELLLYRRGDVTVALNISDRPVALERPLIPLLHSDIAGCGEASVSKLGAWGAVIGYPASVSA
jgi:alpha-glucosidase